MFSTEVLRGGEGSELKLMFVFLRFSHPLPPNPAVIPQGHSSVIRAVIASPGVVVVVGKRGACGLIQRADIFI